MQLFQDRLEAVEVMLLQKPIVSGRYTGYAFRNFVLPLDPHFRAVWQWCARSPDPPPAPACLAYLSEQPQASGSAFAHLEA